MTFFKQLVNFWAIWEFRNNRAVFKLLKLKKSEGAQNTHIWFLEDCAQITIASIQFCKNYLF